MNNCNIEYEIIKKYIIKRKQERIFWELQNPKKREEVVWKNFPGIKNFKPDCLREKNYMSADELKQCLKGFATRGKVYYLGESIIGELQLDEAMKLVCRGEICLMYCGNGIAYYQGEEDNGVIPRFLLIEGE